MGILLYIKLTRPFPGFNRFSEDVAMMIGKKPNIYFRICWMGVTPAIMIVSKLISL